MSDSTRFWAKVEKRAGGCWVWTGGTGNGYGKFHREVPDRRMVLAHRWAWESTHGPIPEGLQIDHLCRVRGCVNPSHLEPVTRLENVRRGLGGQHNAVKTHCKQGHLFDAENTIVRRAHTGTPVRKCRECSRASSARKYARRRAEKAMASAA